MGMRVCASRNSQSFRLTIPYSDYSFSKSAFTISFASIRKPKRTNGALAYGFVHPSAFFGSGYSKGGSLKPVHSSNSREFYDFGFPNENDEMEQKFESFDNEDESCDEFASVISNTFYNSKYPDGEKLKNGGLNFSLPFPSLKLETLRPSFLGIQPKAPVWPERSEIIRESIERKANSVELPISLRMIKKKRQLLEESFKEAGEFTYCSVNKAFASMVFMIRELQSCALSIRGSLYCEDLQEIIAKVQREINASFVWLFQQVFSRTPTLMIYLMILLANFTVYSMADKAMVLANPLPEITEVLSLAEDENQMVLVNSSDEVVKVNHVTYPDDIFGDWSQEELTKEEMNLWNSVVEEASRMQEDYRGGGLDHETVKRFVSPVNIEIETDDNGSYFRTKLLYQMGLAQEPDNPLLLSNYAQFLYLVSHDNDRAEKCFTRALQAEPPDAEVLGQYADFLWKVKNDLWGAEERYQQAMAMEPDNPFHASRYANFLWSTGGEDTCFPLSSPYDNRNRVCNE